MSYKLLSVGIKLQAETLHGGQMVGSGRMWVNPIAEHDPRAVSINMKGEGLPFESILTSYLPKVAET